MLQRAAWKKWQAMRAEEAETLEQGQFFRIDQAMRLLGQRGRTASPVIAPPQRARASPSHRGLAPAQAQRRRGPKAPVKPPAPAAPRHPLRLPPAAPRSLAEACSQHQDARSLDYARGCVGAAVGPEHCCSVPAVARAQAGHHAGSSSRRVDVNEQLDKQLPWTRCFRDHNG